MKKDDIIGQKLFETCKLSEFYLNLITNSTYEDTESPTLLSTAYRHKLYEIVERYDRLLETSRQRERLCLTFDNQQNASTNKLNKPPTTIGSTTRTSTPNKYFTNSAANTPAPTPTSFTANPKYHPLATTPSNQSFLKSSISNYTISSNHQRLVKTNSSSTLNNMSLSRSSSTKNLSKVGASNTNTNSNNHSNSLNQSKLAQRLNYIYYDYTDEEDDDDVVDDDDYDEDEDEMNFYNNNNNNNNKNNYYNSNNNNNNNTNKTLALNLDSTKLLNKLNKNSTITESSSSSLLCSIKSMNTRLDRLKINLNDSSISDYSNITNVTSLDQTSSISGETNQIEKSFSNMSKDSGVFASEASGYNSDFSSTTTLANSNGDKLMNGDLTNNEDESINNNSTSPSSSTSSTTPNENYDDDVEDVDGEEQDEEEEEEDDFTNSYDVDSNKKTNNLMNNNRLLWSNMPQKSGARIVKGFTANQLRSVINPTTGTTTSVSSLKEQFLTKKLLSQQDTQPNKYSTMILNKPKVNGDLSQTTKLMNLELDLNDLDNSNMMSLMMMNNSTSINHNNNNSNIASKDVLNGSSSTPSPSSSTISSSSSNNSHNDTINRNDESILSTSPETTPNNLNNSKQPQFFFNSYNSLMNVSMLDNIQATNTSLEFDNMNSSILTFN